MPSPEGCACAAHGISIVSRVGRSGDCEYPTLPPVAAGEDAAINQQPVCASWKVPCIGHAEQDKDQARLDIWRSWRSQRRRPSGVLHRQLQLLTIAVLPWR